MGKSDIQKHASVDTSKGDDDKINSEKSHYDYNVLNVEWILFFLIHARMRFNFSRTRIHMCGISRSIEKYQQNESTELQRPAVRSFQFSFNAFYCFSRFSVCPSSMNKTHRSIKRLERKSKLVFLCATKAILVSGVFVVISALCIAIVLVVIEFYGRDKLQL